MRQAASKSKEVDESLQQAFTDMRAMMDKAKELVELAKRFEAQRARQAPQAVSDSDDQQFKKCADFCLEWFFLVRLSL